MRRVRRVGILAVLSAALGLSAPQPIKVGFGVSVPIAYPLPNGKPVGFAVEVLNEAARREGLRLEWRRLPQEPPTVEEVLRRGEVDLIPSLYDTPERQREFYVSAPWWLPDWTLLVRETSPVHTSGDLAHQRLQVAGPLAIDSLLHAQYPHSDVKVDESSSHVLRALCAGQTDAAAFDRIELNRTILLYPDLCRASLREVPVDLDLRLSLVARRPVEAVARRLRAAIDELTMDGTLAGIAQRNPPVPSSTAWLLAGELRSRYQHRVWVIVITSLGAVLALALFFLLRQLRTHRDLRRSRDRIAESEERFNLAVEYAGMGVWDLDLKSGKMLWTRRFFDVLGLAPDRAEPSLELWKERLHPEDRDRVLAAVQRAQGEHSLYSCLYRVIRADNGAVVWLDAYGRFVYDHRGNATRFIGIFADVTGRKRAEPELEAILDAVPAATFIARDPECRHIIGSRMTYDLLQRPAGSNLSKTAPEEERPMNFRALKEGRELTPAELPVQTAARTGQPVRDYEFDLELGNGGLRRLFGNAVPLLDEAGQSRGAVAAFIDITELKAMEERLRHAQKIESIGLLAGGIAHDFNNLLVAILGNASLACDVLPVGHPAGTLLRHVIAGSEQAALLTRQLLAYAGKGRFIVEPINLSEAVRDVLALVQPAISRKITVRLDLPERLPAVEADRGQIQQVLMNLMLNAAEAVGERPGVVAIWTALREADETYVKTELKGYPAQPGTYVCLKVQDSGCGMDEVTRARMFDPFFTTKFTGRGLGLAAVDGIVRGHRGAIRVITAPGRGTTFEVLFPAGEKREAAAPAPAQTDDARGHGTVLVVDDEEMVRDMARRALEHYGYSVLVAAEGQAAVDLFRARGSSIDVVVLDLSMPGRSGEEVLPDLQKIRPQVAVVVSSGYSEAEALGMFAGARVAGFIQKPYTSRQIAVKVKQVLQSGRPLAPNGRE